MKASWHPPTVARPTQQRVARLLGRWPSIADLARDIGASYWTVYSWGQRGYIPDDWWDVIVASARRYRLDRAVTYEILAQIAVHRPKRRRGPQTMKGSTNVRGVAA